MPAHNRPPNDGPPPGGAGDAERRKARFDELIRGVAQAPPMPVPVRHDPLPSRIDRYEILDRLGEGGMGVVYLANDERLDRKVAIKLVHPSHMTEVAAERLLREARALARLSHPNVIPIHEVGNWNDRIYLVMEYVDGWTLRDWVLRQRPSTNAILSAYAQATRGLQAAHSAGLIHRDFKPENALLGRDGRVRVADFGIVGAIGGNGETLGVDADAHQDPIADRSVPQRLTRVGRIMGTPAYMAPEQLAGHPPNARSDQYSLCVSLWESLFGRRPFEASERGPKPSSDWARPAVQNDTLTREPPQAAPNISVPDGLVALLVRGLSYDPDARFASLSAVLEELERLSENRSDGRDSISTASTSPRAIIDHRFELLDTMTGASPARAGTTAATTTELRRAYDRLKRRAVVLRMIALDPQTSRAASGWTDAWSTVCGLRHPNIAAIEEFGIAPDGRIYCAVDLPDGSQTIEQAARSQPRAIVLNWISQILQALVYLHRQGIEHLRLCPETVRIAGGQVRLLDCGLSALFHDPRTGLDEASFFSAPEINAKFLGDHRADLFSVGKIISRLLLEQTPSHLTDTDTLRLGETVARMSASDAISRYANAREAIEAIGQATGRTFAAETTETRESFLQASTFVGRQIELGDVQNRIATAMTMGTPVQILIGGESGAGKSRMAREVAAFARSQGATVLHGQARREAARPFDLWHDVFAWLTLSGAASNIERDVFAEVTPSLASISNRSETNQTELGREASDNRIKKTLFDSLSRLDKPLVVFFEDLQWAGGDSLELIADLAAQRESASPGRTTNLPIVIVGTYRADEAPEMPARLPNAHTVHINRLLRREMREMATSIVGTLRERSDLTDWLWKETEGNVLFLVEVLRALGEQAGTLDSIASMPLPEKLFVGGVSQVLRRRLDRIGSGVRKTLDRVAIIGRELDTALLKEFGEANLDEWLDECKRAAILEHVAGKWRFVHDQLRETVLSQIAPERRITMHVETARVLEKHDNSPRRWPELAYHFRQAEMPEREAVYASYAGELALRSSAFREAAAFTERAVALADKANASPRRRMRNLRMLAQSYFGMGRLKEANLRFADALRIFHIKTPKGRMGWFCLFGRELATYFIRRALPMSLRRAGPKTRKLCSEASLTASRMWNVSLYEGDTTRNAALSFLSANLADRANTHSVFALGILGYLTRLMGSERLAEKFFRRARTEAEQFSEHGDAALTSQIQAVSLIAVGRPDETLEATSWGIQHARETGDAVGMATLGCLNAAVEFFHGRFEESLLQYRKHIRTVEAYPDHVRMLSAGEIYNLCLLGRLSEAQDRLDFAHVGLPESGFLLGKTLMVANQALIHVWSGRIAKALDACTVLLELILDRHVDIPAVCSQVPLALTETAIIVERCANDVGYNDALTFVSRVKKALRQWIRVTPSGRPLALIFEGRRLAIAGKADKARRLFDRARTEANHTRQYFYVAFADLEAGRTNPNQRDPTALRNGRDAFASMGCAIHVGWADALLEGSTDIQGKNWQP